MVHKLRKAMGNWDDRYILEGMIKMDEGYFTIEASVQEHNTQKVGRGSKTKANTWEGEFPVNNTMVDGHERRAEVKSYPPNDYGLYDMSGNVWEWTSDWYSSKYDRELQQLNKATVNPKGPQQAYNPNNPYATEK